MSRLTVLELAFGLPEEKKNIHPVIISDAYNMVLIDCGYTGALPAITEGMAAQGIDLSRLTQIIITHHDHDHMGSLAACKRAYPGLSVLASSQEAKHISGKEKSLRLLQVEDNISKLTGQEKAGAEQFRASLLAVEAVEVDQMVSDHEVLPYCGGIEIIATPGHMPGHISVYHHESKTLITGDAMVAAEGNLGLPNAQYTLDMVTALKSMEKFLAYDIETIICYHGGVVKDQVKISLQQLLTVTC